MAEASAIEWTDATWNPITGCSVVSPGCTNCYAMKLAGTRLRNLASRKGLTVETQAGPVWNGQVRLNDEWLLQPLQWRRPRKIFVCAHGDLFAEAVPDTWVDRVFAVMAAAPHHTFQVLTKRSARMRSYLSELPRRMAELDCDSGLDFVKLPLPNVWLGVSAEDQRRADERVPDLLETPAAVRFVSAEPLLGPIDFTNLDNTGSCRAEQRHGISALWKTTLRPRLDWIIVGGESGPGARPMHPDWARQIRDACVAAGVAFHFKQHGAWLALSQGAIDARDRSLPHQGTLDGRDVLYRVGKKAAGRLLDGVEHNGFPASPVDHPL
ncbi:phage Gp37/Gp68 family protein [Methylobacterium sp. J-030]|uniref:phage Gp37/Gp68 family protein n=1 Tax=Methylobacterium sp. J-030 TaxID=2836627 RepID=UPI001FB9DDE3|nr:phage Gp37/Gp68 family protein [Methylobacterium sp. J-030]MCJ2069625.1 phage Gp37/Gp68 family protein [Methylobacterium sp. J-030]